jgi:DNA-binding Xre family transcriptional regulator
MSVNAEITATLKRFLRSRGVTYAQLASRLGLSEASVKRVLSRGPITLDRLDAICAALELDFQELARMCRHDTKADQDLTLEQETALADDAKLLAVFSLLLNDWSVAEICAEYMISTTECVRLLSRLDRLGLIVLLPGNRVKLNTAHRMVWRRSGPIRKRYESSVLREFFAADFAGQGEVLRFEVRELGSASLSVLQRRMQRLAEEFNELAELDASLPARERHSVGFAGALRPWVFSALSELKRKARLK